MTAETDHGPSEAVAARIERRWATVSIVIIGVLVGMAAVRRHPPGHDAAGHVETADPRTLHLSGEFIESNLGSEIQSDGSVIVRAIGQQYSFTAAMSGGSRRDADYAARHQRRRRARAVDRGD